MFYLLGIYLFVGVSSAVLNLMKWISPVILLPFLPVIATVNIFFGNKIQKKEAVEIFKLMGTVLALPVIPFIKAYQIKNTQPVMAFTYVSLYGFLYLLLLIICIIHW